MAKSLQSSQKLKLELGEKEKVSAALEANFLKLEKPDPNLNKNNCMGINGYGFLFIKL